MLNHAFKGSSMRQSEPLRSLGRSGWHVHTAIAVGAAIGLAAGNAFAATATAIEFFNPVLKHYFITAYPEEAAALDAGNPVKGWFRTGGEFTIFTDPGPGRSPVCRFFGTPGKGINSHFYTADADECAKVRSYPAWTFEAIAYYIPTPTTEVCPGGLNPVYRSYFTDNIADANHRFTIDLTAHVRMPRQKYQLEGVVMCAPISDAEAEADVVRFLEQATLGPTEAQVQEVKAKGIAAWIDEQIPFNATKFTQLPFLDPLTPCVDDKSLPWTPDKWCETNKGNHSSVAWEFFRQARTAPDQLRMRMAHVWHQILPTDSRPAYATAEVEQRYRDNAFGTFENLLLKYALSPQLGEFQNWLDNVPEHDGVKPNENFARELMQLFTIGVNELNEDGTTKLDASGRLVPTYGQADIEAFARVLTGFTHPTRPGNTPQFRNPVYLRGDMIAFDQWHDQAAKSALSGRLTLPPGGGAMGEVRAAIKVLVDHPNTPPFIARQLIQKTVTSSPTPGYVARVAAVFKNNGSGVRGDLAALTRAVLLDPEARGARKVDPEYGRMREPALLWTAMIRALDVVTDGRAPHNSVYNSAQNLFFFPTVFGYYPADFTLGGTTVPAPEFGIFTSAELMNRANQVNDLLYNVDQSWSQAGWGPQGFVPNATGTPSPTLAAFLADAGNADVLVERMNKLFLHGAMRADMRNTLVNAVNKLAPSEALRRVKLVINLTLVSVDYQVEK